MFKFMTSIALVIGVVCLGLFFLVHYLERNGVFFPGRDMTLDPSRVGLAYEDLYLTTADGVRINAWFVRAPGGRSTLIFAHGNAGTMSDRIMKIKFFHDLGLNVLIFDYRGYGRSEGRPSEKGLYRDALAAYDHLKSRTGVDMKHIIVYGASLGGAVAVDLACHRPIAALVADSSITSAKDMAGILYPYLPSFFLSLKFDNMNKIKHLTMPKLFIHSPDDHVVPFSMGRRLFEAAASPKEFLQSSGGHNDAQIASDPAAGAAFKKFLDRFQLTY